MKHTHRIYARLGFIIAALGVILGAFGSHVLKEMIGEVELNTFDTGVRYQMIHALAIIVLALHHRRFDEKKLDLALALFIAGILIFSGSLYLLATRTLWGNDSFRIIGAITPLGGIAFISAWLILFFKGFAPVEEKRVRAESLKTNQVEGSKHKHRKHKSSNPEIQENL